MEYCSENGSLMLLFMNQKMVGLLAPEGAEAILFQQTASFRLRPELQGKEVKKRLQIETGVQSVGAKAVYT